MSSRKLSAVLSTAATLILLVTNVASAASFSADFGKGDKGSSVTRWQEFLTAQGLYSGPVTGFFGALTAKATMAAQKSWGIKPVTGYVGPKTRKFVATLGDAASVSTPNSVPSTVVNTGSSLWVAADNSMALPTSIIAGAGQVRVGGISFTAPATSGVTVTGLTFTKSGVLSDSSVNNMYVADAANGNVIAQFQSLSAGVATFSGLNINVAAGQTWRAELRVDISSTAGSGNTIAFDLTGATTAAGATVAGLPVKGNVLTVTSVSNPSIAGFTMTANSVGSSVDAGTNGVMVSDWTMNVTNSPVDLKSVTMTLVGSANTADMRNVVAKVNGEQVASVPVGANTIVFSFASKPVRLQTGNSNFSVYADVAGSPNRTMQFTMLHPYDVVATDSQYNQNITASITTTNATSISIRSGSITVSTASDSPTNPIPAGASGVTIGKFTIYAAGEPVKIKYIDVVFTKVGSGNWSTTLADVTAALSQVRLVSNDGRQVGNTISTIAGAGGNNDCSLSNSNYITCHFGTSSSNINFIIPANTTSVLSAIADIGSAPVITALSASLPGNASGSLEGQISFQAAAIGAANGASRTVNSTPLTVAANPSLSAPTYINGAQQVKIASFVFTASSAQAATVRTITLDKDANAGLDISNLTVMVGDTQFGATRPSIAATETAMSFSGDSLRVPAGGSITVDIYADILNSTTAATYTSVIDFTGWTASGGISGSSITFTSAQDGQNVEIASGPTVTISKDSNSPSTKKLVMGSKNNDLFWINFLNNNVDDVYITDLTITDTITGGASDKASFTNLGLYNKAGELLIGPLSMQLESATTGTIAFSTGGDGLLVPKNSSAIMVLKGDVPDFTSGGAVSGSSHVFSVFSVDDVGGGTLANNDSDMTVVGAPVTSNAQKVYRTKLSLSSSLLGASTNRARTGVDELGKLNLIADPTYQVLVSTITVKFVGGAVASSSTPFTVDLIDSNTNTLLGSASQQTCTPTVGNTCSVTFVPNFTVSQGTTKETKIRVNSSSFSNSSSVSDALSALIYTSTDVLWSDGTSTGLSISSAIVPFTIASVSYE